MRWTEVTIDNGDNAKDALDRITFPQEVLDRIAPTALPLSSITISDEPLSSETNYRTEFVVVLNNQPQGGFANRTRSPDMNIARDSDDTGYGFGRQRDWAPSYGYSQPARSAITGRRAGGQLGHLLPARAVMAGLVPAIHVLLYSAMAGGWLYLMTNRRNGILYAASPAICRGVPLSIAKV